MTWRYTQVMNPSEWSPAESSPPYDQKGIGLGLVKAEYSELGTDIQIISGRAKIDAKICELPFYKEGTARKK